MTNPLDPADEAPSTTVSDTPVAWLLEVRNGFGHMVREAKTTRPSPNYVPMRWVRVDSVLPLYLRPAP